MAPYSTALVAALGCASAVAAAPEYVSHPDRMAAVKATFQESWDGYYKYAFPKDSLLPVSKTGENDRNGWGASAIDAISTALIMDDAEVVQQILEYIPTIDWQTTAVGQEAVSVFETTIRYLGGLLSAHDLLSGPKSDMADADTLQDILDSATKLADVLSDAFDTETGIPQNTLYVYPTGNQLANDTTNGLATIGTLILEFSRLSDLTGDSTYHELAAKAESYLLKPLNPEVGEPFPGMLGTNVNIKTGEFADSSGGWNGGTDSYYEYLIKMYLYDTDEYEFYKERWVAAVDSSIEYLASSPKSRPDLTWLAAYDSADELSFVSTHLACFDGGNIILGGLTLDKPDYVDFGIKLTEACHATYTATATGIGPDSFYWQDSKVTNSTTNPAPPANQTDFFEENGFWIGSGVYDLRPEVIESFYYAYRATGDTKYQDWVWDAYLAINATTAAGVGHSAVNNVNVAGGGGASDFQESFWFAEVLKYSYLAQAPDAVYQVNADKNNQWVFNTEAHPVKVNGKPT